MSNKQAQYYTDQLFDRTTLPHHEYAAAVFENCTFKNCDLSNINCSGSDFIDTEFDGCNLSMAKFDDTGLKNVNFINCKLVGIDLERSKNFLFSVNFKGCLLDHASFNKKKNKKAFFIDCSLKGVEFNDADLTETVFQNCDFMDAVFSNTILDGADLTSSYNFHINPDRNSLKKARFTTYGLAGLLSTYGIIIE